MYQLNYMIKKKLIKVPMPMTKGEIYCDRKLFLSQVTSHRCSKKKTESTQFHFTWAGRNKEWMTIRDVRAEFSCPPPALLEYAEDHRLLEGGGPWTGWLQMDEDFHRPSKSCEDKKTSRGEQENWTSLPVRRRRWKVGANEGCRECSLWWRWQRWW